MQKGLLFFLLFTTTLSKAQDIDVAHYLFSVALNDRNDSVYGGADILFTNKTAYPVVQFDLASVGGDKKGMLVDSVKDSHENRLRFEQREEKLIIHLTNAQKDTLQLASVYYRGIPRDGLIISKNKFGERTFFADHWPNRAHNWLPCNDRPDDKASVEFYVAAPSQYQVVSNGIKKDEKQLADGIKLTHWVEDSVLPTKVMVIGAARFATKTFDDSPKNLPVSAWVYPQDSAKGFYDFALAPSIVRFFSDYIAPFPYSKLANVQSTTIFGGMENASCIFYAEHLVTGDRSIEETIAHEIAHQWFGDMASEKSFAHLWLSEGFASYMTDIYIEKKYGREAFTEQLQKEREDVIDFARRSKSPVVDSTANLMSLLNGNSYQKGAWVLHMLRNEVGDSTFHQIIQTYYNTYKGGNAETRDFEAVAERVSGKDLKWFFDQWLYRPGIPRLLIKKTLTEEGVQLTIGQLQKEPYRFTLPVSLETKTEKEIITPVQVSERVKTLLLTKDKTAKIIIDPNNTLLYDEAR